MFDRKSAKKKAIQNVKKHYYIFLVACLVAAIFGVEYSESLTLFESRIFSTASGSTIYNAMDGFTVDSIAEQAESIVTTVVPATAEPLKIGIVELGTTRGVFSSIINRLSGGKGILIIIETIQSVIESDNFVLGIAIAAAGLFVLFLNLLIRNAYKVSFRRIFMESYCYDKIKYDRFAYLIHIKKFVKASVSVFVADVYQWLWDFTVIGGFVKHYSYMMVPYIVAENPDISRKDAIDLSRRMMYGHKAEAFRLDLSLIGWYLLSGMTMGLSSLLFSNEYREALLVEYYVYLRDLAKQNKISYASEMNDTYLFEKADSSLIEKEYSDIIDTLDDSLDLRDFKHKGFRGFIENNFGIIYKYDQHEDLYNKAIEQQDRIEDYKLILDQKQYPTRLSNIVSREKEKTLESIHYLRHYSIWHLVMLFFIFCFAGWNWEVLLHLITDGELVNRGVLHGPWLPIYGSGAFLILTLLFRARKNPRMEALLTVLLCGTIEFWTSWILEKLTGTRWWDYSGYFLNIEGRICAEGLLVFMLGGLLVVYLLGPRLDNKLRKVKRIVLVPICVLLLLAFGCDCCYSYSHPNMGEGITDDAVSTACVEQVERM